MSAIDLAHYIRERLNTLGMTTTAAADYSGISRQTWHKLLRADIHEAKLSTVTQVAQTLDIHPLSLLRIYFHGKNLPTITVQSPSTEPVACRLISDVTYPDNAQVKAGEEFEKVWEIVNLGKEPWIDWRLQCVEGSPLGGMEHTRVTSPYKTNGNRIQHLQAIDSSITIPETQPGEHIQVRVKLRAPTQTGTAVSHWRGLNAAGEAVFPPLTSLYCMVDVVAG